LTLIWRLAGHRPVVCRWRRRLRRIVGLVVGHLAVIKSFFSALEASSA
jgi:hypothetical protein